MGSFKLAQELSYKSKPIQEKFVLSGEAWTEMARLLSSSKPCRF